MARKEILLRSSTWMQEGSASDIVLSSRVRLARNLENTAFPQRLSREEAEKVEKQLADTLQGIQIDAAKLTYLPMNELASLERHILIEKHLISPALLHISTANGVALTEDHRLAAMVNEEDHLRLQALLPGDRLEDAYQLVNQLDDELESQLDFAYSEARGYLTACPTNVGTGMRASVMVHLPALVMAQHVQPVLGALTQLGLAVRGLYGEGSHAYGNIYQVSNQITLGKSEEDILTHLGAVTKQLVEHENQARIKLKKEAPLLLEDKIWRARGTLENARLLSSEDALQLLSLDRLGIAMGILPGHLLSFAVLLVNTLPASLQYVLDEPLEPGRRDAKRAEYIREAIKKIEPVQC